MTWCPISKILLKEIVYSGYFYFLCSATISFQAALLRTFLSIFTFFLSLFWYEAFKLQVLSRAVYKDVLKLAGDQDLT